MSRLIIVRDPTKAPKFRCRVCQMRGEESVFFEGEERAYEHHVVACSSRHDEELRMMSPREKAPGIFDPERSGDVEFAKWVRKYRKPLIRGDMKL